MNMKTAVAGAVAAATVGWSTASVYAEMQKQGQDHPQAPAGQRADAERQPAFLGVAVAEVPAPQGTPLDAPALVVGQVHPGSPAEAAGLLTGDVLLQLNDQRLVHPVQLSRLVSAYAPGQEITLKLWRQGEVLDVPVALAERPAELRMHAGQPMPPAGAWQPRGGPGFDLFEHFDQLPDGDAPRWEGFDPQRLQQQLDQMQQDMQRQMQQLRDQMQQGGDAEHGQLGDALTPSVTQQSLQIIQSPEYRIKVRQDAEGRHLHATDAQGNILYEGPIDTPEQLRSVPAEVRELLPESGPQPMTEPQDPPAGEGSAVPAGRAV